MKHWRTFSVKYWNFGLLQVDDIGRLVMCFITVRYVIQFE
jgi:hypothetical protein